MRACRRGSRRASTAVGVAVARDAGCRRVHVSTRGVRRGALRGLCRVESWAGAIRSLRVLSPQATHGEPCSEIPRCGPAPQCSSVCKTFQTGLAAFVSSCPVFRSGQINRLYSNDFVTLERFLPRGPYSRRADEKSRLCTDRAGLIPARRATDGRKDGTHFNHSAGDWTFRQTQ